MPELCHMAAAPDRDLLVGPKTCHTAAAIAPPHLGAVCACTQLPSKGAAGWKLRNSCPEACLVKRCMRMHSVPDSLLRRVGAMWDHARACRCQPDPLQAWLPCVLTSTFTCFLYGIDHQNPSWVVYRLPRKPPSRLDAGHTTLNPSRLDLATGSCRAGAGAGAHAPTRL